MLAEPTSTACLRPLSTAVDRKPSSAQRPCLQVLSGPGSEAAPASHVRPDGSPSPARQAAPTAATRRPWLAPASRAALCPIDDDLVIVSNAGSQTALRSTGACCSAVRERRAHHQPRVTRPRRWLHRPALARAPPHLHKRAVLTTRMKTARCITRDRPASGPPRERLATMRRGALEPPDEVARAGPSVRLWSEEARRRRQRPSLPPRLGAKPSRSPSSALPPCYTARVPAVRPSNDA
jgi:hypothetical protein